MKHFILGAAGHIDHGKTALIKALSGKDCDTHPEEKKRGITINLGFSSFLLESGEKIGIIDVPGHVEFIRTMVHGARGFDAVLMVIAADSGIMPQTKEHFNIIKTLGIKQGIIALTKIDLVDEEILEIAEMEIRDFFKGSFLEKAPVIRVSAISKDGISSLKDKVNALARMCENRSKDGIFRMYPDRVFSVKGAGTIVTGSIISGFIKKDQSIYLLPGYSKMVRIRKIEKFNKEEIEAFAGDRASLNLAGIKKEEFRAGMQLIGEKITETSIIDVCIEFFEDDEPLKGILQVFFLSGTYEAEAKVRFLDSKQNKTGEKCFAQILLSKPAVLFKEDTFIIRQSSNDKTIGGGVIIDAYPLTHRKKKYSVPDRLSKMMSGDIEEIIANEVQKNQGAISLSDLSIYLNVSQDNILRRVKENEYNRISINEFEGGVFIITKKFEGDQMRAIAGIIEKYHIGNPYSVSGLSFKEIQSKLVTFEEEKALHAILEKMEMDGCIKKVEGTYILKNHTITLDDDFISKTKVIIKYFENLECHVPLDSEISVFSEKNGITKKEISSIIKYLIEKRKILFFEGSYILSELINGVMKKVITFLLDKNEGATVSEIRQSIHANRKFTLLVLSYFDDIGITLRKNDRRVLTSYGKRKADLF